MKSNTNKCVEISIVKHGLILVLLLASQGYGRGFVDYYNKDWDPNRDCKKENRTALLSG